MDDQPFLPGMDAVTELAAASSSPTADQAVAAALPPRLRLADRVQARIIACSLDELLPAGHRARLVLRMVESLDMKAFSITIAARGSEPGRAATDPRILVSLWLFAAIDGVGSGREIARLCECHDAYRWLAGGVSLNYHTLNDFRVGHDKALDNLFTQVIALLVKQELIEVARIAQDGMRVRASAGSNTFRSESTLKKLLEESKEHVRLLKQQNDPAHLNRQQAKRLSDAKDREKRLTEALEQLPALREAQEKSSKRSGHEKRETRVSMSDPDARVMKMADGGFRPAYNVQIATDTSSRAIVAIDVVSAGSDGQQAAPLREQAQTNTGEKVKEHLVDGGYAKLDAIGEAEKSGVKMYAPLNKPSKPGIDAHERKQGDSDEIFAWRQRMKEQEAKDIYKLRGSTVETINGDLAQHRGLRQFPVRGSPKVKCIALWLALSYNILHFGTQLLAMQA
jgi:transposase